MNEKNKILIIDDTVDIVDLLQKRLRVEGYEIFSAYDGEEGLRQVAACAPDLVILDVMMPKLDGFEVLKRLKADEKTRYIPVLMLTARAELPDKIQGFEIGADDYLTKPFDYKELAVRVKSLFARKAANEKLAEEEKSGALDHMLDEVAHEVRNPLGGMELFTGLLGKLGEIAKTDAPGATRSGRIVVEHLRTAAFLMGDGVVPGNVDQAYVLRRLIRRAIREGRKLGVTQAFTADLADVAVAEYGTAYPALAQNRDQIRNLLQQEEEQFASALERGTREFNKLVDSFPAHVERKVISGRKAFYLYETYGFPLELTAEMAGERGFTVDTASYHDAYKKHQELSRAGAEQKFKGGLADASEKTAKLHTATHLLQAALRKVLGDHVGQAGSNITADRLRFDFTHGAPVSKEEQAKVEALVNDAISRDQVVTCQEMALDEARAAGAIAETDGLIVIGSQAILASCPEAPPELVASREVDLYPADNPAKADLIDGSIGEGSLFDEEFSYYAHGVGPETAKLPSGWRARAVALRTPHTRGVTAFCLHPADRWLYRGVAMQAAMFGMRPRTAESRSVAANGGIAEPTQDGQPSGQPHLRMTSATVCMIGSNCSKQRRA